ncbi:hypothetical protein [Neobacillus sp. CF12]|uniref:hypothetical protein n=1 Tax=Neobacillus sp. CF12 TaxID=3055864 RepID=UPI0025A29E80|nr:hypothetical protein [Neobacillus sp. CF12]MDM5326814.1 hypothetical protein [Neobacillus sp. CF12]
MISKKQIINWVRKLKDLPILKENNCVIEYKKNDAYQAFSFGKNDSGTLRIRINQGFIDYLNSTNMDDITRKFNLNLLFYHELGHLHSYINNGLPHESNEEEFINSDREKQKEMICKEECYAWDKGYEMYVMWCSQNNELFYEYKENIKKVVWENAEKYLDEMMKYNKHVRG